MTTLPWDNLSQPAAVSAVDIRGQEVLYPEGDVSRKTKHSGTLRTGITCDETYGDLFLSYGSLGSLLIVVSHQSRWKRRTQRGLTTLENFCLLPCDCSC